MSNTIDCSRMSHTSCEGDETEPRPAPTSSDRAAPRAATADHDTTPSYDCVNDCVSSLGVTALLSSTVVTLSCFALPAACPIFAGTAAGAILGACEGACETLEREP